MGKKDPKWKYIGVWFLAGAVMQVLNSIISTVVAVNVTIENLDDLNVLLIAHSVISTLIVIGVFIFVYNIFSTLNMKKVFTYLVILGGLGKLASIGLVSSTYSHLGIDLTTYNIFEIVSFFVIIFVIRAYYINKPDRWY